MRRLSRGLRRAPFRRRRGALASAVAVAAVVAAGSGCSGDDPGYERGSGTTVRPSPTVPFTGKEPWAGDLGDLATPDAALAVFDVVGRPEAASATDSGVVVADVERCRVAVIPQREVLVAATARLTGRPVLVLGLLDENRDRIALLVAPDDCTLLDMAEIPR